MRRCTQNILTVLLCFLSLTAVAQDTTAIDVPVGDTVFETTVVTETNPHDGITDEEEGTVKNSFDSLFDNNEAVAIRSLPDSLVKQFLADDDYWYASAPPQKKKQKTSSTAEKSFLNTTWFSNLFWIVVISTFIGLLVWYIATGNAGIWQKKPPAIASEQEVEEEDIFALDFVSRIQQESDRGNYRMATRLWYLQTLKNLSDRNIINYTKGSTNSQYLAQMTKSGFYKTFFQLTRGFEYTWYGNFQLSQPIYQQIEKDFIELNRQLLP